jgi:predicted acylesterase/phospholipase RssA
LERSHTLKVKRTIFYSIRKLNIGITNLHNGTFVSFNDNFKTRDLLHVLKASVAYPGIFKPYKVWNSDWITGSSVWSIDVTAPIIRCKSLGFEEEDIVLDVVVDSKTDLKKVDASDYNAFEVTWRSLELMEFYNSFKEIILAKKSFPKVDFRTVVGPQMKFGHLLTDIINTFVHFIPIVSA